MNTRTSALILASATLAMGGLAGYAVAAATASTPTPTPVEHVIPVADTACEDALAEWGSLALANADTMATIWQGGSAYTSDVHSRNVNALAYQYADIMAGCGDALPACETEDSDGCYWDADIQGNGQGRSFIAVHGRTIFTGE